MPDDARIDPVEWRPEPMDPEYRRIVRERIAEGWASAGRGLDVDADTLRAEIEAEKATARTKRRR